MNLFAFLLIVAGIYGQVAFPNNTTGKNTEGGIATSSNLDTDKEYLTNSIPKNEDGINVDNPSCEFTNSQVGQGDGRQKNTKQ